MNAEEQRKAQRRRTAYVLTGLTLVAAFFAAGWWWFVAVVVLVIIVSLVARIAELYDRNQELLSENWNLNAEAEGYRRRGRRCNGANAVAGCTHGRDLSVDDTVLVPLVRVHPQRNGGDR